jgi:fibronectin-binding autotransporter adhesin
LTATTGGITATGTSSINASGAGNNSIGTGTNSGTISIGNTNSAAVSIDSGTAGITIGTTANAHATTVGSTNSTSSTTLQSGSGVLNITATGGALTINSGVGVLAISNDASATTVNIGTGGAAKTVTLGSTNTTSTTTIQAGSGGVKLGGAAEGTLVTSSAGVISTVTGTAGFVLTANAAGTSPSFQTAPGGGVLTASVNLTNAQIKAIHATPITIVAAQGAGTTIQLISCAAKLHYGGTNAFVDGSAFGLSFYYTNNAGVQVGSVMTSTVLTQTSNRIYLSNQILATNIDTSFENLPVVVTGATATEITGNAANNNTITVNITYKVITL